MATPIYSFKISSLRIFLLSILCIATAAAQEFPSRPIRIVVPYAAGGGTDTVSRLLATRLSATLGQPVLARARNSVPIFWERKKWAGVIRSAQIKAD